MIQIGSLVLPDFPLILAPMEDISDPPFRILCKSFGVDLMFTEFISSEGLIRDAEKSEKKLDIFTSERPIGIQVFGHDVYSMLKAVEKIEKVSPDIIDINFGCPVKKVVAKGAGAALLRDLDKMQKMTAEIVKHTDLPVTVKTRLGWDENHIVINEVAERLQDVGIKAISIHGRTRKQMYGGQANWKEIARVKKNPKIKIPVFANGDIKTPEDAQRIRDEFGLDGAMIGRAAIGNPWIFKQIKHFFNTGETLKTPSVSERVDVAKKHLELAVKWKGERLGILETRPHYSNYFKSIPNFKPYRIRLVTENQLENIFSIFDEIKFNFNDSVF
jgi:nifR3 family TIM-barrel protein